MFDQNSSDIARVVNDQPLTKPVWWMNEANTTLSKTHSTCLLMTDSAWNISQSVGQDPNSVRLSVMLLPQCRLVHNGIPIMERAFHSMVFVEFVHKISLFQVGVL
jgi:hypothetical protein